MSARPFPPLDGFCAALFARLMEATRAANQLPLGDDYEDASFAQPQFGASLEATGKRLAVLVDAIAQKRRRGEGKVLQLGNLANVPGQFDALVEVVDGWLESVDTVVDRLNGVTAKQNFLPQEVSKMLLSGSNVTVIKAANVLRPQLKFVPPVDNSALTQFVPKLREKPHAKVALDAVYATVGRSRGESVLPNPYEFELQHLVFPDAQLQPVKERIFGVLEATPCAWIDKAVDFAVLVDKLCGETEIAVDLEQHFMRSYQGFVCLMQISTRKEDFLVDTLALRNEIHHINRVFADPKIVKVMHGADHDILWLQRDFSVYVVNLFDTGQASRVLSLPKKSLAYLLELYAGVQAQKQYQLADWRIRPLPEEMRLYAQQDTHYLLYVYDVLRNKLASSTTGGLLDVWNRSRLLCLETYQKPPVPGPTVDESVFVKMRVPPLSGKSLTAYCELNAWRDDLARREDESVAYVMPNRMMYSVAEKLACTVDEVLALCVPVPPLTRAYAHEVASLVHKVRAGLPVTRSHIVRAPTLLVSSSKPQPTKSLPLVPPPAMSVQGPPLFSLAATAAPTSLLPASVVIGGGREAVVDPSSGAPKSAMSHSFASLNEGLKSHKAAMVQALAKVGVEFDPLFASRVGEAAGVFEQSDAKRPRLEEEEPAVEAPPAEPAMPQSLAEIHRLTTRNKSQQQQGQGNAQKKRKERAPVKEASPLDYKKLAGGAGSSPNEAIDIDSPDFVAQIGWGAVPVAPTPSGTNPVAPVDKEKRKRRNQQVSDFGEQQQRHKPHGRQ